MANFYESLQGKAVRHNLLNVSRGHHARFLSKLLVFFCFFLIGEFNNNVCILFLCHVGSFPEFEVKKLLSIFL